MEDNRLIYILHVHDLCLSVFVFLTGVCGRDAMDMNWGMLCQKHVSRAETSNYITQYLWDVITCPSIETCFSFAGIRLRNFEICVGVDGNDIGNNAICHKQLESVAPGLTKKSYCSPSIIGNWVSINKSDTEQSMVALHIQEVRVYGSK